MCRYDNGSTKVLIPSGFSFISYAKAAGFQANKLPMEFRHRYYRKKSESVADVQKRTMGPEAMKLFKFLDTSKYFGAYYIDDKGGVVISAVNAPWNISELRRDLCSLDLNINIRRFYKGYLRVTIKGKDDV